MITQLWEGRHNDPGPKGEHAADIATQKLVALKEAAEEEDDEDSDDDEINWDDDDYEMCEVPRGWVEQIPMYPSSDQYTPSLIDRASLYSRANQFDSDPPNTPRAITAEMASGAVTALSSEYEILSQPSSSREVTTSISELNISPSREIETPSPSSPIQIDPDDPMLGPAPIVTLSSDDLPLSQSFQIIATLPGEVISIEDVSPAPSPTTNEAIPVATIASPLPESEICAMDTSAPLEEPLRPPSDRPPVPPSTMDGGGQTPFVRDSTAASRREPRQKLVDRLVVRMRGAVKRQLVDLWAEYEGWEGRLGLSGQDARVWQEIMHQLRAEAQVIWKEIHRLARRLAGGLSRFGGTNLCL